VNKSCVSVVLVAIGAIVFPLFPARAGEEPAFPPAVQRSLAWLPSDTETVTAVQAFQIPSLKEREPGSADSKSESRGSDLLIKLFALTGLFELDKGKYFEDLAGNNVVLALRGARNVEVVSSFGALRDEGCAIVVLEKDLAKGWLDKLKKGSKEVRTISGRDVLVFPSTAVMEPWFKPKPWQGTFLVALKPNTLLCATSDRYLEEVLNRVDAPSPERALPDNLPEWKHLDPNAPAWLLRHVPENRNRRVITGLTLTMADDQFRVVYLPAANSVEKVEQRSSEYWFIKDINLRANIGRGKDGSVVVSGRGAKEFIWHLIHLPGEEGNVNSD